VARSRGKRASRSRSRRATAPAPRPAPDAPTFRGLVLNDFQRRALPALREGRSVLLAAPTGAGKTLVAEVAIEMSLERGRRAIYTAPVKALSNQKFRDFKAIDADRVGLMTGDVTINPTAPLLVMTTEIFRNTIFENPRNLDEVETVVFDEIHYMDDVERGTVWEESIIFAPDHVRFVCLSATIANLDQYGDWISRTREREVEVIRHRERPVPLDHYLWFPGVGLRAVKGKVRFPTGRGGADRGRRGRRGRRARVDHDPLIDALRRQEKLPILFFCFSRRECAERARQSAEHGSLLDAEGRDRILELFDSICGTFELESDRELETMRMLAGHGIAYHHAGMLPLHKELVERLFTSGRLRLLFATETFSLGINMPARTVVFSSLRKFDGVGFSTLKVREYQQMAGRAGRQGIDERGMVVAIIDDDRVEPREVERLLGNDVEPIVSRFNLSYSTLINLHATLGERLHEAWERSFNNFQWARMSGRKRAANETRQREAIDRRLRLLRELDYISEDGVLEKGRQATAIYGYELPVVELLHEGLLEVLDEVQLAILFASLVYEPRPNDEFFGARHRGLGRFRRDAERIVGRLVAKEKELGIRASIRPPELSIASVIGRWCQGDDFDRLHELTTLTPGDLVRVMRQVVQLLRQVRAVVPPGPGLAERLDVARQLVNRDAVDAVRQFNLG